MKMQTNRQTIDRQTDKQRDKQRDKHREKISVEMNQNNKGLMNREVCMIC